MAATPSSCAQFCFEEEPRAEGAADTAPFRVSTVKRYFPVRSVRMSPVPQFIDRSDEVRAIDGGPPQLVNAYEPDGNISIRAYGDDLTFLLNAAGFTGVHTAGDGVITDPGGDVIPAGVHRWVFTKRQGFIAKTLQAILAYVDHDVFFKGQGFGLSTLNMNADGEVTADMVGIVLAMLGADPELVPAYPAFDIPFFRRGDAQLEWLTDSGVVDDFSFAISNPLVRNRGFGVRSYFPNNLNHGDERVRVTGTVPMYTLAEADMSALIDGETFSAVASWEAPGQIGVTGYPYKLFVEMPKCQYIGGQGADDLANRRRHGGTFDWWAAWDESVGFDVKITVMGTLAAIETYA